jgi:hypothetical protein
MHAKSLENFQINTSWKKDDNMSPESKSEKIGNEVNSVLKSQGYFFAKKVAESFPSIINLEKAKYKIRILDCEIPYESGNKAGRIDFAIGVQKENELKEYCALIVVECKRVNPKFRSWCFFEMVPGNLARPSAKDSSLIFSSFFKDHHIKPNVISHKIPGCERIFDLGLVVKKHDENGDKKNGPRANTEALEDAMAQVINGVRGLNAAFRVQQEGLADLLPVNKNVPIIPMVITSSELYRINVTNVDGEYSSDWYAYEDSMQSYAEKVNWGWIQYRSQFNEISIERLRLGEEFSALVDPYFTRSIAIVHHKGVHHFLQRLLEGNITDI